MKRYIQTVVPLSLMLFALTCTFCVPLSSVQARAPRAGIVSPFDNSVGGEPGEDPHLCVDPRKEPVCIWSTGGSSGETCTRGDYFKSIDEYDSSKGNIAYRDSQENLKWRMFLHLFLGTLIR